MECLVVHELLHIHMRTLALPGGDASELAEEQVVNALAGALTSLHSYFDVYPGMRPETNPPPQTGAV